MADSQSNVNNISVDNILTNPSNPNGQSISDIVNNVFSQTPTGSLDSAISDAFYGINHRQMPSAILSNKDVYGLTFFTRPRLNLTSQNIQSVRQFGPLLNKNGKSLQRVIRHLLDPELAFTTEMISSPLVDEQQAFIPILTNSLLSISGWPDLEAPTHTSHEGIYKEAFSFVDGVVQRYETFDLTATFRGLPGDPITMMFLIWLHYMAYVYLGNIVPYPDALINNEIDYNTRIYRLVLDVTKTKVQAIAACGAAFPTTCPIGAKFNYEAHQGPYNTGMDQLSVNFRCMGAIYQDDILIREFNQVVWMFNHMMNDAFFANIGPDQSLMLTGVKQITNQAGLIRIPLPLLPLFNNRGYPRINIYTYELEWWVTPEMYNQFISGAGSYATSIVGGIGTANNSTQ